MAGPAIRVGELGKRYRLAGAASGPSYRTLRESLANVARSPFRRRPRSQEFWALNDVSFEVNPGDVVGIVGRNGSGKSTLLKILSRITKPTRGFAEIDGRVGSLLEVGTGFHPELTGRENVYLNGSILGMSRREIAAKFDEIVAFAAVEKFLDTPVKRYSSGMYVRLAFAVAAHLEPEIMLVDEVLAVGDAEFQKKCLGKMGEVARGGRTILFVSHSMTAVTRLCTRGVLLDGGRLAVDGTVEAVVHAYLSGGGSGPAQRTWPADAAPGGPTARLLAVRVTDDAGAAAHAVDVRRPVRLEMEYAVGEGSHRVMPSFMVTTAEGVCAFTTIDRGAYDRPGRPAGRYRTAVRIPGNLLADGTYLVAASMSTVGAASALVFAEPDAVAFEVRDGLEGDSARGQYPLPLPGAVRPDLAWQTEAA